MERHRKAASRLDLRLTTSLTFVDMYDCDFENSMCRWTTPWSIWKWKKSSASLGDPAKGTGPVSDGSGSATGKSYPEASNT